MCRPPPPAVCLPVCLPACLRPQVFRAQLADSRLVAVKAAPQDGLEAATLAQEANILHRCAHPNVLEVRCGWGRGLGWAFVGGGGVHALS